VAGEVDGDVPAFLAHCGDEGSHEPLSAAGPWEGGDLLAGEERVYLGWTTLRRARERWGAKAEAKLSELARNELALKAVLVPSARQEGTWFDYHLDMLAAILADGSVLLGDPDSADAIVARSGEWWPELPADRHEEAAPRIERAEQRRQLAGLEGAFRDAGAKVHRVPLLVHPHRPWMLSYTNVLQEEAAGERIVYLPQYGLPRLDAAAAAVWRKLGHRVRPIHAAPLIPLQGSIRCLTNVLARSSH
jgi:hypothetical protein